ncbi:MAG: YlxR family protein [Candidatus Eremiobacteraeota bacterium]|nr:YlxR family protein [Candidatus Eremiobacteraeota bacterium]MBV9647829.1 YlxR family protein [Candidatus Eremiobacteraeota bacterium]
MCVGCRTRFPQAALVRYVRADSGRQSEWRRDPVGRRRPGRGAYLCSSECAVRVKKNRRYPGLAEAAAEWNA